MPIEKPLPLMVGNKAFYSLTSYDPVEIEVVVPYTADEDIEVGLEMTLADLGGTMESLDDPAWVAEHFDGLTSRQQVEAAMRKQVEQMNAEIAEEQKVGKCVEALVGRLGQSVPPQHVQQARQAVQMRFNQQLQEEGLTPDQFLMRSGATVAQLEEMFDRQAQQMVEGDAALSAYAHEKKLKVDEQEYSRLLGISPDDLQEVMEQARTYGQLDEMREAALRSKACQIVVTECSCTYVHESPQEAHLRIARYRAMQQQYNERFADGGDADEDPSDGKTGFKLV